MLIDPHTHTAMFSPCSILTPDELCALARERGLKGLVLTEHNRQWPQQTLEMLRRNHPAVAVYSGVEISMAEGFDVICICHPALRIEVGFPTIKELNEMVAPWRDRAFLFAAHLFRYVDRMEPPMERILESMDGIEMNSVNILRYNSMRRESEYVPADLQSYEQAADRFSLLKIYSSDAHHPSAVGSIASRLDLSAPPADEDELVRALKTVGISQHQNPELIRCCL